MRRLLLCIGFVALLAGSRTGAAADAAADCRRTVDWDRRIAACTQIIGTRGTAGVSLPAAYNYRGFAHFRKGDYDRAVADNSEAIRLDPKFAHAYNSRGLAHIEKRNYDGAVADLSQAIHLDPKLVTAYSNRGWAYI
jgi:Flp pilus assembly protein TadD